MLEMDVMNCAKSRFVVIIRSIYENNVMMEIC